MGSVAVALASPIASPEAGPPKPPMPKDDNEDLAVKVTQVGNCPVGSTMCPNGIQITDRAIEQLLERGRCKGWLRSQYQR